MRNFILALLSIGVAGHGQLNHPPSTRQGIKGKTWPGALTGEGAGGYCEQPNSMNPSNPLNGACMIFSQPSVKQPDISIIPGEPTLNHPRYRTMNINVSSGPNDWTRKMPWRAPGTAPVLGSGCGVAGGGIVFNNNGGWAPTGMAQGSDPLKVLPGPPNGPTTHWASGSTVVVAMGVWANHGGGYSYRLCKNVPGNVSESCFQRTPLKFAESATQWLQHINGTRYQIPMTKFVAPSGAEWARIPFPTCAAGGNPDGHGFTDGIKHGTYPNDKWTCGPNGTEYPEPLLNGQKMGLFGFGYCNHTKTPTAPHRDCNADKYHDYSIVDRVVIPSDLEEGDYLLSWRWDCEQTTQIWQNCADVHITK